MEIWRSKQGDIRHLPRYVRELAGNPELNPLKDPKVDITIIKRYYYDSLHRWHAWDIHPALQLIYAISLRWWGERRKGDTETRGC